MFKAGHWPAQQRMESERLEAKAGHWPAQQRMESERLEAEASRRRVQ